MEDPWSSSSKAKDDEFEEVWSELHSLKKLYGILQKTSVNNSPNGEHAHDSDSTLDEKSRRLLKKLLDGATHQALQSQTNIVFSNPGSTPPSGIELQKETVNADKLPECHPAEVHHDLPKSTGPEVYTTPNQPETMKPVRLSVAEPKISRKASALPTKLDMKRQTSIKSTRSSHGKLHRNRYRQIDREHDHDRSSSKLRSTKVVYDTPSDTHPSEPKISLEDGLHEETTPRKKLQDCHPAAMHHDKPMTSKPEHLPVAKQQITQNPSPVNSKLDVKRQASMKSTRSSHEKLQLQLQHHRQFDHNRASNLSSSKLRSTRDHRIKASPDLTVDTRTRQTCNGDLLAVVPVPAQKRARVDAKDTGQTRIDGRVDRQLTHSKRSEKILKVRAKPERGKSRMDRKGHRRRTSNASSCAKCTTKHVYESYGSVSLTSSSSRTSCYSSSSSSSSKKPTSRRMPVRPGTWTPSRHREVGPPQRKVEPENKEGRLKRLKNKLAIIFHHHHHHHHHIHDGANNIVQGGSNDHRSPWKYLRGILHQKGGEEGGKQAKAAAVARVPARKGPHGYFHALLEGLIRHVWGMKRRKKKKVQHRLGATKVHWWQRFRRRGGARPANRRRRRPRLRLGFKRINSQNPRKIT